MDTNTIKRNRNTTTARTRLRPPSRGRLSMKHIDGVPHFAILPDDGLPDDVLRRFMHPTSDECVRIGWAINRVLGR